jgi:hypothetical protein
MQQKTTEIELLQKLLNKVEGYFLCPEIRENWVPKKELQIFLGFSDNQFKVLIQNLGIRYVEIGKQRFYSKTDLLKAFPQG